MPTPHTASLFDEDRDQPIALGLTLAQGRPASNAQRQFQKLVAQIEMRREQIKGWQAYSLRYNQRICNELEPLRTQLRAGQLEMVALIDEILTRPAAAGQRLGRRQIVKLRALLVNLLQGLLEGPRDQALEALHDRYSDVSCEERREHEMECTRSFLNEVVGVPIEESHGASSTEELLQFAYRKFHEQASAQDNDARERSRRPDQARRDEAAKEVSQSLREVFRKLVSALHPDREQEPSARQRKTLLMQRVNQAYEANDLLTLLGLQLEIEQIDAANLSALSGRRLSHYIQILREQLAELDRELEHCIAPFLQDLDRPRPRSLTIADVDRDLSADCAQLSLVIRELRKDRVAFRDPKQLRRALEGFEVEPEPESEGPEDLAQFAQLFEASLEGRPGRRRRRNS